jgi:hypothetical protein
MATTQFDVVYANKQIDTIGEKYSKSWKLYQSLSQGETIAFEQLDTLSSLLKEVNDMIDGYYDYLVTTEIKPSESYITKWLYEEDVMDHIDEMRYFLQDYYREFQEKTIEELKFKHKHCWDLYLGLVQREEISKEEVTALSLLNKEVISLIDGCYDHLVKTNTRPSESPLTPWLYEEGHMDEVQAIQFFVDNYEANMA